MSAPLDQRLRLISQLQVLTATRARSRMPTGAPALLSWVPKLGLWAWSFVGFVAAMIIVILALAAVSEIVLPMTFAAVLAVIFKPLVGTLRRHRFKPTLAAGVIVLGLLGLMTGVVVATVQGVLQQTDQINASVNAAVDEAVESSGVDQASLDAARAAIEGAAPMISEGFLTHLVAGVDKLIGLASVVNFIGGYIPYIGAFLGGGLAVIVALGDGGPRQAAIMLVVVLVSNLALENFVEPKVMGRSLDVHPLVVLVVTAFGGLIGGIVGLILAVPFFVIARSGIARLRSGGFFGQVADRAEPTLQRMRE